MISPWVIFINADMGGLLWTAHLKETNNEKLSLFLSLSLSCWRQKIKSAWVYGPSYFPPQGAAESHSSNPEISTNLLLGKTLLLTFSLRARMPLYLRIVKTWILACFNVFFQTQTHSADLFSRLYSEHRFTVRQLQIHFNTFF